MPVISVYSALSRTTLVTMLALSPLINTFANGQQKAQKPSNKPAAREERTNVYRRWVAEVSTIITPEESRAFDKLATDEERDHFIHIFWLNRDPDPDTPENEYKDQYYERQAYANEHFSSGIPGSKTERGRIYITFGKPDQIESHPAGGSYERPSWEGGGSTSTYPFEVWRYNHIEGIGSDIEIEFVDPTGSGEYRMARNPFEKDALLHVPGAGPTLGESLGLESRASRVAAAGSYGVPQGALFGTRSKDSQFDWLLRESQLHQPPAIRFPELRVRADLPEISSDLLPFAVKVSFSRLSAENAVASIAVQFDHNELSFSNRGTVYSAKVNLYARVVRLGESRPLNIEQVIETTRYTEETLKTGLSQQSIYEKSIPLKPGRYKLDVVAKDIVSGKTGVIRQSLIVPAFPENELTASSLILADSIQPLGRGPTLAEQFVKGRYKVRPFLSANYKPGQSLSLFLQLYDLELDQSTLKASAKVEYVITRGGVETARFQDDEKLGKVDVIGRQLIVTRSIPLTGRLAEPGNYEVLVRVTDLVGQRTVTQKAQYAVLRP